MQIILDLELKAGKKERSRQDDHEDVKDNLRIPQVDLFDLFQVNRCKILDYLLNNSDEKNAVSGSYTDILATLITLI